MIVSVFTDSGFTVSGHSGYSQSGSDIVCAAVSAMVMLVCNTITERFGAAVKITLNEDSGTVELRLDGKEKDSAARLLIDGFEDELRALAKEYPENLTVLTKGI